MKIYPLYGSRYSKFPLEKEICNKRDLNDPNCPKLKNILNRGRRIRISYPLRRAYILGVRQPWWGKLKKVYTLISDRQLFDFVQKKSTSFLLM